MGLLAQLFTASHLKQLAWYGSSDLVPFARRIVEAGDTLADLLDRAFAVMRRRYPAEYVFKACLLKRRLFGRHSPRTTSCYFELPVGTARADVVLVNGDADVFEVKSRFDSAERLEAQVSEYYNCFSRVSVVVEDGQEAHYLERLRESVGVFTLKPGPFSLSEKRRPEHHYDGLNHSSLYQMLHQPERHRLSEAKLGLSPSQFHPAIRYRRIFERFESLLSPREAHTYVVEALRNRQRTESLARRCTHLPASLHVAGFSYDLRVSDWQALFRVLKAPGHV